MKIRIVFLITIAAFITSCGGTKKVQGPPPLPKPEWVTNRQASSLYYYGVGAARKSSDISQYQQAARQNALADMANEISISISSNSVINAFESNLNFREDYTSSIRAQTQQDLEGYEMLDSWEDENNYWVYYRLSKSKYQELKEKRKSDAVTRSLDFFTSALNARDAGATRLAIVQFLKALEPIKPYFTEPLPVDLNGNQVYLGNEIFKELSTTIAAIEIKPLNLALSVKNGKSVESSLLKFEARHKETGIIAELPLVVTYSEKPIRNNKQRTTSSGLASFDIDRVSSSKAFETFTATVDLDDMLTEAGSDPLTRKLVTRFNLPQGVVRINIEKPVVFIESSEVNLGETVSPSSLEESIKRKAIENGYLVKNDRSEADYIIKVTAVSRPGGESGQFKSVNIEGFISVESRSGDQLYYKPLEGFTGRHLEFKQASEDAFRELRRRIEISYFREIHEKIGK